MKRILCFLCTGIAYFAVAQNNATTIRVDLSNAYGGTTSQIFDSVSYIPLETTTESMFGEIDKLVVVNNLFIILDRATNSICIFKRNGVFNARIKGDGYGIDNFYFDPKNNLINVVSSDRNYLSRNPKYLKELRNNPFKFFELVPRITQVNYYNLAGKKVSRPATNTPLLSLFGSMNIAMQEEDAFISCNLNANANFPDTTVNKISVLKNGKVEKGYFPYNIKHSLSTCAPLGGKRGDINVMQSTVDEPVYVTIPFDYSIYEFRGSELNCKYKLVFPAENTIPANYINDSSLSEPACMDFLQDHPNTITAFKNICINGEVIYLDLFIPNMQEQMSHKVFYSKKSQKLYDLNRIVADASNYFLPLYSGTIQFSDKSYYYTSVSSPQLFQTFNATQEKHPVYPPSLKKYFSAQKRNGNPVVVLLKLKADL